MSSFAREVFVGRMDVLRVEKRDLFVICCLRCFLIRFGMSFHIIAPSCGLWLCVVSSVDLSI